MNTRVIQREFTVEQGYDTLPPVTLSFAWSAFMNSFAVWPGSSDSVTIRRTIDLQKGYYYVTGAVDNFGSVNINGQYNITLYNFDVNISRTVIGNNTVVYHAGGPMTITISATNTGGPRGVAVTISEYKQDATPISASDQFRFGTGQQFIYGPPYVGALVWSTRTAGTASIGRYQVTMPFRANITAHAWGAGAGAGGLDSIEGGRGSSGLYNTAFFQVERGDTVEVFVGTGGLPAQPTVRRQGSTSGGVGGPSVTSIGGDATKSFNGGRGGRAGPAGWSGGGGGGGGASGVLVNNVSAVVAGGGGGGGGGGNFAFPGPRQSGDITNNAIGDYNIGVKALNIDDASSITRSAQTQLVEYNTLPGVTEPPLASGSTKVLGFGYGSNIPGIFTRTAQTNNKINLVNSSVLTFFVRKGSLQVPDRGEDLHLEYSTNGSTWISITTVPVGVVNNTWLIRSPQIPSGAKVAGGVFLRYRQSVTGSSTTGIKDLWAMTSIFNGSPTLDFRGEAGSDKGVTEGGGDGGGGGGGGGGFPGGQGGGTPGGDIPGAAGQCGGNFPDNVGATSGTNTPYYRSGFGAGSLPPNGTGQNGRVVLLIEPISLVSVKVADEWKQSQDAFVKVSGAWQEIDIIYIKIDDVWREINGVGQGDIALTGNTQNYGTSARSFS
jgi:hypothetical protein